jgi:allophanate hydrolase
MTAECESTKRKVPKALNLSVTFSEGSATFREHAVTADPERALPETVSEILTAYRSGAADPATIIARTYARIRALNDSAIFISLLDENDALAEARKLAELGRTDLPLYGIPVGIKDNIDAVGLPTTAACPAFSYRPRKDATAVARLREAGAIIIGKTNLDQFATGLVGVRSPYGIPRNALDPALIPGGSSSGSAVAVATGIVPVTLGTDTAGSGRMPAMLNNIVGLKPSLGLVSNAGVVPACRTLDCISVFALTTDDASTVLSVIAGYDARDPFSRRRPLSKPGALPASVRVGVPRPGQRVFFSDKRSAADYSDALDRLARLGAAVEEIDIEPFYETARLLYEGPWVAERYAVTRSLIASSPESMHPVTREIILGGARTTAVDAFSAFYQLEGLRRSAHETFEGIDVLALPTAPTLYTVAQVLADPIQLNSRLGTYTNFVNLLDLCGLAIPSALHDGRTPFGITLLAPGGHDGLVAAVGRRFHADTALPLGALHRPQPPLASTAEAPGDGAVALAVVGAHLSGMALNHELRSHHAQFVEAVSTAPDYRLYALAGTNPPKPGLLRVAPDGGSAIEVEVWAMPAEPFGRFVAAVPPPLSIGSIKLADGRLVKGFLVEAEAVNGARDISQYGGWRNFVGQK